MISRKIFERVIAFYCIFPHFGVSKSAILTHLEALHYDLCEFLPFLKAEILTEFKASKMAKKAVLEVLHSPKLISRKIQMTEKS